MCRRKKVKKKENDEKGCRGGKKGGGNFQSAQCFYDSNLLSCLFTPSPHSPMQASQLRSKHAHRNIHTIHTSEKKQTIEKASLCKFTLPFMKCMGRQREQRLSTAL